MKVFAAAVSGAIGHPLNDSSFVWGFLAVPLMGTIDQVCLLMNS